MAKAKLRAEMAANAGNPYVQLVGKYLLDLLTTQPEAAEALTAEDKSILGSFAAMEAEARKKKTGNMAMLTPDKGYAIVRSYFGIPERKAPEVISLDDLLGGA